MYKNYSENYEIESSEVENPKFEFDKKINEFENDKVVESFIKGNALEDDLNEPFERINKALEYIVKNQKI